MDLDGSNLLSTTLSGDTLPSFRLYTFALSHNNVAWCLYIHYATGALFISKITVSTMTTESYEPYVAGDDTSLYQGYGQVNSFVYGAYVYFYGHKRLSGESESDNHVALYKIPTATWNDFTTWTVIDLTTGDDIALDAVTKFYLGYDSTDQKYYGYLAENNLTDRQRLYQVDLDTLALLPFRRKSLTGTNPKILTGEFSNDTQYPIQKRVLSGANDDPAGGEWANTTGGE
jgi:hypothetical protein